MTADSLMVRQYRNALDRFTLELPAGGLNQADEPDETVRQGELEEETGYRSDDLEWLITLRTTVALCNEKIGSLCGTKPDPYPSASG